MTQADKDSQTYCRVAVVDDHPLVRRVLKSLLTQEPALEVVGEAASAEGALELFGRVQADVVLVDFSLPGMSGLELIARLGRSHPRMRCLVVSSHHEALYVDLALQAGARGYVVKGGEPDVLVGAITQVMRGKVVIENV